MTRTTRAALCAAFAALAVAPAAHAATADVQGGAFSYTGGAEQNSLLFSVEENNSGALVGIRFHDTLAGSIDLTAGARSFGCMYYEEYNGAQPNQVTEPTDAFCPVPQSIAVAVGAGNDSVGVFESTIAFNKFPLGITVDGGEGDDRLEGGDRADTLRGGPGNDALLGDDTTAGGNDRLFGEAGNDKLTGMAGNDLLDGGEGDDELEALHVNFASSDLDGADTLVGGPGKDGMSYFLLTQAVSVSFDGQANDGRSGEGDNVGSDVEEIVGGSGDDTLTGDAGPNALFGSDGNDTIAGGDGNDVLDGGSGDDRITGGAGNDEIEGDRDSDDIDAGPGEDRVIGDGPCSPTCRPGLDTINVRDGEADFVQCGGQTDTVIADQLDNVDTRGGSETCEVVDVVTVNNGGNNGSGPAAGAPRSLRLKAFLSRGLPLTIACAGRCMVSAKATVDRRTQRKLRLRSRTVATGKRTLAGGSGRVAVKPTRQAKRGLKRLRKARLTIAITVVDANGRSRGTVRTTIRR